MPSRAANLDVFTDDELQTIEDVLGQLDGMTGTQVSELSRQEPGWRLTEVGETIPFSTAFLDFPQVSAQRHFVVLCSIASSSRNTPEDGLSFGNDVPLLAWLLLRSRACSAAVFRSGI